MKKLFVFISAICLSIQTRTNTKTRIGLCTASASITYAIKNYALSNNQKERISKLTGQAKEKTSDIICQLCNTNFFCAAVESHQRTYGK